MNVYEKANLGELIEGNPYVGRGIVIGKSADGRKAMTVYFIMGRSENSRNRIFKEGEEGEVTIYPYDASKVKDPSLIIYSPIRVFENNLIVTNGDQTDTIYEGLGEGKSFSESLKSRKFEPDGPNFTPRISGMITLGKEEFTYQMSILKSADEEGTGCNRFTFDYEPIDGVGHFIHTYVTDGEPLPTFVGEPERVEVPGEIEEFVDEIWMHLDERNKISIYGRSVDLYSGKVESVMINKYE